jgi:hypothetical protein
MMAQEVVPRGPRHNMQADPWRERERLPKVWVKKDDSREAKCSLYLAFREELSLEVLPREACALDSREASREASREVSPEAWRGGPL